MSQSASIFIFIVTLIVFFGLYFLPTIIARKKSFALQLFLLNLLLGWTFLGWVISLVWAFKKEKVQVQVDNPLNTDAIAELEKLNQLRISGVLTEDEFVAQKQKIMGGQLQPAVIKSENKLNAKIVVPAILMFLLVITGLFVFYIIPNYVFGARATAYHFFEGMKNDTRISEYMESNYLFETEQSAFPKISKYEIIKVKEINADEYIVIANISGHSKLGNEITREFGLLIKKEYGSYKVSDSYNVIITNNNQIVFPDNATDLEKVKAIKHLRGNLEIVKWNYSIDYFGAATGNGIIRNNSDYPVRFVEVKINYYDRGENLVNSDKDYAIDSNELQPGESRAFSWYTSNCGSGSANIEILVDKN